MKWVYGCMCSWSVCTTLKPRDKKLEQTNITRDEQTFTILWFSGSCPTIYNACLGVRRVAALGGTAERKGEERGGFYVALCRVGGPPLQVLIGKDLKAKGAWNRNKGKKNQKIFLSFPFHLPFVSFLINK